MYIYFKKYDLKYDLNKRFESVQIFFLDALFQREWYLHDTTLDSLEFRMSYSKSYFLDKLFPSHTQNPSAHLFSSYSE